MKKDSLLKNRKLYVIFSITLIAVMGVASITPAMPQMAIALNLSETRIGLLISAFTLPGIFLTPLAGIYADRRGRKKILVPSLFIFAIAGFAIFFIRDFYIILLLRALQGVGAASLGSLNVTLIGDFFKGKQRPAAMGYNASVLNLSTAIYPLVGGALAGFAWYYPFVLPLLAIPVGLFVIFGMEEPEFEVSQNLKEYFQAISKSIFKKEVLAIFTLSVLTFIILYGSFLTYMPFLLKQKFNLSAPGIGIVLSLSSITSAIFATQIGKLTTKFGSLILLKTAFFLYFTVLILVPNINNLYLFILPILIFGSAQALNIPSLQTVLANLAPDNQRGAFMSMNGMVLRLGQTLGPLVIGIGFTISGLSGAYYLGAFIAILGLFVLFTMLTEDKIKQK
ncbi:MAG: MFS transporter [Bacteroidales bacterium]|nr:MFS transporter [Bacteroidales bacterium]